MRTPKAISLLAVTSALALFVGRSEAQVVSTEPIDELLLLPDGLVSLAFPNVFDLTHPKLLTLSGIASVSPVVQPQITTLLDVQFDWLDLAGEVQLSPLTTIPVPGAGIPTPVEVTFTVPFCPEEVSVHFLEQGQAIESGQQVPVSWYIVFTGTFTHECLVPEADALIPAGLLLTGVTVWGWRRRASKAS